MMVSAPVRARRRQGNAAVFGSILSNVVVEGVVVFDVDQETHCDCQPRQGTQ